MGSRVDLSETVFPLLKQELSGQLQLIGAGFFIAQNGIFATAKHVITDVFDDHEIPTKLLVILQFLPNKQYLLCPIHRCTHHAVADVAVGAA
jgi:hypothetical protein